MVRVQSFNIASDDLWWIVSGVRWTSGTGSISGVFQSPGDFIDAYGVTVDSDQHTPVVPSKFTVLFRNLSTNVYPGHTVTGMDGTSYITVATNPDLRAELEVLQGIPDSSPLLVTLAADNTTGPGLNEGIASIHWEISRKSPKDPTTPQELSNHVCETLSDSSKILADYTARLANPYNNAKVTFVDGKNNALDNQPLARKILVRYRSMRSILCEGDVTRVGEVSCNSDIGNFYVDANGIIHIVIDSTIIKMY